ncbi:MAG: DNA-binding domain-containing protein [Bacteroidota bacterium]|nr:DNA-binding domain-containing protein [Bacteroidota bacterium]
MNNIPLDKFQEWMQGVIEHPGNDQEAWHATSVESSVPYQTALDNVLPSQTLQPMERIAIYRNMFYLRMVDAMEIDFPGVLHFLGEETFDKLIIEEYVQKFPSHSYTLNYLGKNFPRFIQESNIAEKEFLFELATLELAITTNMDEDESPVLTDDDVARVPVEKWEEVKIIPIAAFKLFEFDYAAGEYLDAVLEKKEISSSPSRKKSYVMVYRNNYTTWHKNLAREEYTLLKSLSDGTTLGEGIALLLEEFSDSKEELQDKIFSWFNSWVTDGIFQSIKY